MLKKEGRRITFILSVTFVVLSFFSLMAVCVALLYTPASMLESPPDRDIFQFTSATPEEMASSTVSSFEV